MGDNASLAPKQESNPFSLKSEKGVDVLTPEPNGKSAGEYIESLRNENTEQDPIFKKIGLTEKYLIDPRAFENRDSSSSSGNALVDAFVDLAARAGKNTLLRTMYLFFIFYIRKDDKIIMFVPSQLSERLLNSSALFLGGSQQDFEEIYDQIGTGSPAFEAMNETYKIVKADIRSQYAVENTVLSIYISLLEKKNVGVNIEDLLSNARFSIYHVNPGHGRVGNNADSADGLPFRALYAVPCTTTNYPLSLETSMAGKAKLSDLASQMNKLKATPVDMIRLPCYVLGGEAGCDAEDNKSMAGLFQSKEETPKVEKPGEFVCEEGVYTRGNLETLASQLGMKVVSGETEMQMCRRIEQKIKDDAKLQPSVVKK